tara:strand:+ start:953 stop:1465 length:513 start_codon:yes stop_codon:yes gene_type:complete
MEIKNFDHQILFKRIYLIAPFFLTFLSSCSPNNNVSEFVTVPIMPEEFALIPENNENPDLNELIAAEKIIERISIGRKDPFLPPQAQGSEIVISDSFEYHGQIVSNEVLNAFVSYQNQSGTIKPGDIGGKSTNLLPLDWVMESIDTNTKVLTLSFDDNYLKIDLFATIAQ